MNQQQLYDFVLDLEGKVKVGKQAWANLEGLVSKVKRRIATDDPLISPLTQSEIDYIINYYSPIYEAAKNAIEAAGDAVGTDK
jgi:hypothetical protein